MFTIIFKNGVKNGSWEKVWNGILKNHKNLLDLSSIQLDGTHTPAKRGGKSVAYQGRKRSKTTNTLIITDSNGIPLACSDPIAGNHNDAYRLEDKFDKMLHSIQSADIPIEGLFLKQFWYVLKQMICTGKACCYLLSQLFYYGNFKQLHIQPPWRIGFDEINIRVLFISEINAT